MSFKVQGFGTSAKELSTALDGIEKDLRLLSQLSLSESALPEGKKAIRQKAELLDQQIGVLEKHLSSADPATQKHASALLELAKHERLRLEDGLLAWAMDDIASKIPSHAPALPGLSTEISAVSALLGGLLSPGEIAHVVNVVGPLAGKGVALEVFGPTIDVSNVEHDRRAKKTSKEKLTVVGKRIGPVMGGFLATSALRSFGAAPALAFLTAALAIRSGIQTGKYLADTEIKKVAIQTGMNRLEGETDHDLVRMLERAAKSAPLESADDVLAAWKQQVTNAEVEAQRAKSSGGPELEQAERRLAELKARDPAKPLAQALTQEAELARYLLKRREGTFEGRTVTAAEKSAIEALGAYATRLETAAKSGSARAGFEEAKRALTKALQKEDLAELPSLIQLVPSPSRAQVSERAFAGIMHEYGRQMLAISNPGLHRLLPTLEGLNGQPSEGLLEYLKQRVGPEPSVAEVLALHRFHAEGKLDLTALWPPSADLGMKSADGLVPATLQNVLDGLGHREDGARREWWGRMVGHAVPFAGAAAGAGILALFGDPNLAAYITAIAGTLLGEKIGKIVGDRLAASGRVERTNSGVELAGAFGADYAASISRFLRRDITSGSREEVTARLRKEAGALRSMIEVTRGEHARFAAAFAQHPEAAEDEKLLREQHSIDNIRAPLLAQLENFAAALEDLSKSGRDLDTLRKDFAGARGSLLPLIGLVALDVLNTGPEPEVKMGHGIYYMLKTKLAKEMLAGTNEANAKKGAEEIVLAREAIPRSERPSADALDDWAEKVKKKPEKVNDLRLVSKLLSPAYISKLENLGHEARHLPDERVTELAQETLNALLSQVYARFGLFEADRVPELSGVTVERLPGATADDLSNYKVTAKLPGKGRFEIELDAVGRPIADFDKIKIDLGERLLTDMARAAGERYLASLDGDLVSLKDPVSAKRSEEDGTMTFSFASGARKLEVVMGLDGSLGPDSLRV